MEMRNQDWIYDRRRFLKTVGYGAIVAGVGIGCTSPIKAAKVLFHPGPGPLPPVRNYPLLPPAVVSLAMVGPSVETAVREAVEAAGGLGEIQKGQRVMIKPNVTGPSVNPRHPITTNPEVVRAVIRLVKERGAHPMVGDRPAVMDEWSFSRSGIPKVCGEESAELFPWSKSEYVRFEPKQRHWSNGFRIPKILTEVDHFINVPMLKNHQWVTAEFTCCLKAYVGVCHPKDRWQEGDNALHQNNIGEKIAELNLSVKPLINIVDATSIMVKGGPDGLSAIGIWIPAGLVLASKDRVACDSLAVAVLKRHASAKKVDLPYVKKSVWDQVQIYRSAELGIGQADPRLITLENIKVPDYDAIKASWV